MDISIYTLSDVKRSSDAEKRNMENSNGASPEKGVSPVLESVKEYFSQEFPDKEIEWTCKGTKLTASLSVSGEEITKAFEELIKKYPELNMEASYSYDVREEDRSAQWWGVTRIYTEKENGEKKITSSSSTYWN